MEDGSQSSASDSNSNNNHFESLSVPKEANLQYPAYFSLLAKLIETKDLLQTSLIDIVKNTITSYTDALQTSPLYTKALTSCVIAILGEIIGALLKQPRNKDGKRDFSSCIDLKRISIFGIYGLFITGPFFHWWYGFLEHNVASNLLPLVNVRTHQRQSPNNNTANINTTDQTRSAYGGLLNNLVKLAINQLIMTPPFLLFTLAYIQYFLTLNSNKTIDAIKKTFAVALLTNWKVWTVAQAINFQVVPLQYRVLFGNIVALWWNIYLSLVNKTPVTTSSSN